jgi:hypothetical protein
MSDFGEDGFLMAARTGLAVLGVAFVTLSCARAPATPAPAPGPGSTTATPNTAASAPANTPPRRAPPSRDSLAKLRAVFVAQVMHDIAGRESQPAGEVFKNVQVLKSISAGDLVTKMDKEYGEAMGWNCTNCHRLAPQGNWASDTSNNKVRARFMQQMQNDINTLQLPKLFPKDTPKIGCATCHRGYNEPPPPAYLLPERGKPGGMPFPPARGNPPPGAPVSR